MTNRYSRFLVAGSLLLGLPTALHAQTPGTVGIGTATPDPKAALDISSTDKGLLIPRLSEAQRTAMTNVPLGLMVFQTDGPEPGFWYFFAGQWNRLPSAQQATVGAGNGLSKTGSEVQLGGALTRATTVAAGSQTLAISSSPGTYNTATLVADAGSSGTVAGGATMGSGTWQSFTVQQTGALKVVSVMLSTQSTATTGSARLDVVGPLPATTVAAQVTTPLFGGGPLSFTLGTALPVQAGQQYQLRFSRLTSNGSVQVSYTDGDVYAGGESTAGTGRDLLFGTQIYLPTADANVLTVQAGRLGVGTTAPQVPLHVAGATRFDALAGTGARVVTVDAAGNLSAGATPSGQGDNLGNHTATTTLSLNGNWLSNDGGSEGLRVDNAGNVGVGTSSGSDRLNVNGGVNLDVSGVNDGTVNGNGLRFGTNSGEVIASARSAGSPNRFGLTFFTNSTARLAIGNSGRVGIGLTDPQETLHVLGRQRIEADANALQLGGTGPGKHTYLTFFPNGFGASRGGYLGYPADGSTTLGIVNELNGPLQLGTSGTPRLTVLGSGLVGIGTAAPDRPLSVQGTGTASDLVSWKDAGGTSRWHFNLDGGGLNVAQTGVADYRLYLKPGGNVGINTSNPQAALDVTGNVRASGNFEVGLSIQSIDATVATNTLSTLQVPCPAGTRLLGGGGGFRNITPAGYADGMVVLFSGVEDPVGAPNLWTLRVANTSGVSRDIRVHCQCAKVQ
ncbi:hypothetical protein LJ737_12205 [Hymenobacter sp. 15J16-1T3B]|uniref:hypothetical protein n=1 Tax=Hymenobacter sp. 15J16-1T3B TaxID=2886941 RepID=UPI001D0FA3EF|nr:hypothetical protein [Hymenobacter sp. 15J16-1T3B]MCC3158005.1 hypothetical protein [Hymenobacter sp. 15J16-1T3B]